jgi:hypothetical protein
MSDTVTPQPSPHDLLPIYNSIKAAFQAFVNLPFRVAVRFDIAFAHLTAL